MRCFGGGRAQQQRDGEEDRERVASTTNSGRGSPGMSAGGGELVVRYAHGVKLRSVVVHEGATFGELKDAIAGDSEIPVRFQRVLWRGRERDDHESLRRAGLRNNSKVILDDSAYRHYNHRDREVDGQSQNRQFEEYQQRQASGFSAVNNNGDRGDPACASSVDALDEIRRQLDDIERMIADFEMRSPGCKSDTILQELLTQLVLKLDGIETGGVQSVREARKQQVVRVHALSKRVEEAGQLSVVEAPGVGV